MVKKKKIETIEMLAALTEEGFQGLERRFDYVGQRFDHIDRRFDRVSERFERVEKRLEHLETDGCDFKEALRRIEQDTTETKAEMQAVSRAVDKDAETIVEFDRRIKKLEHAK